MKTKLILLTLTAVSAGLVATASAQNPTLFPKHSPSPASTAKPNSSNNKALSAADRSFIMEAAKGGMMEVAMGQMAEEKGQSAEVKRIGKMMVADHTKANNELMSIAQAKGVAPSAKPMAHSWKSDDDYLAMMVKDHEKDLAAFQKEAQSGTDADVKAFAEKTSAVIRKHLDAVQKASKKA